MIIRIVGVERLSLVLVGSSGSRVTNVSNTPVTSELHQIVLVEHPGNYKIELSPTQKPNHCPSQYAPAVHRKS